MSDLPRLCRSHFPLADVRAWLELPEGSLAFHVLDTNCSCYTLRESLANNVLRGRVVRIGEWDGPICRHIFRPSVFRDDVIVAGTHIRMAFTVETVDEAVETAIAQVEAELGLTEER